MDEKIEPSQQKVTATAASQTREEPGTRDMYADQGYIYNYSLYAKSEQSLRSYFNLPVVREYITKVQEIAETRRVTLLDLGSGVGVESKAIESSIPNVFVVSLELSDYGSKTAKEEMNTTQIQASALEIPLASNSVDAIHSKDVFVHLADKDKLFSEVARILTDSGLLLITTSATAFEEVGQVNWNLDEVAAIAKKYGLHLVQHETTIPETDDWYKFNPHPRAQLLFMKDPITKTPPTP